MATQIEFLNATTLNAVVYWLNGAGEEIRYAELGPYDSYVQSTYAGHRWLVRDAATGMVLGKATAEAGPIRHVVGSGLRAGELGDAVFVDVRNDTPLAVGLYRIGLEGREEQEAKLRPGETRPLSTSAGEPWRVRSLHCGTDIGLFAVGGEPGQTIPVELRSVRAKRAIEAAFRNDSALTLDVLWLDDTGKAVLYHRLGPGQRASQPTFRGHPWLLRDAASGTPVRVIPSFLDDGELVVDGARLHSLAATHSVSAAMRNMCAEAGDLVWVGYDGSEKSYGVLDPGAAVSIETFAGHPWRLRATDDGEELAMVVPGADPTLRHDFTPVPRRGRGISRLRVENGALLTVEVTVGASDRRFALATLAPGAQNDLVVAEGTELVMRHGRSGVPVRTFRATTDDAVLQLGPRDARSQPSSSPVTVRMTNRTPLDIEIFWADAEGKETRYGTIAPGATHVQETYAGHVWRARERFGGRIAGIYCADGEALQEMSFTMQSLVSAEATGIRFVNRTSLTTEVCWMDYSGQPQLFKTLEPGASVGFRTFVTHPWIVRDRHSGRVLDWTWGNRRDSLVTIDERDLRPRLSENPVDVTFTNRLPWPADLFRIDEKGREQHVETLAAGATSTRDTFETHPWRVRQPQSGAEIAVQIATGEARQAHEIALRSVSGDVPTEIVFRNQSPLTLNLFWIDYSGREVQHATLEPRTQRSQGTMMSHPWVLRDAVSGETVGFTVGLRERQALEVTGATLRSRSGGETRFSFTNASGLRANLFWVSGEGNEVRYATLDPGQMLTGTTYATHVWRLREAESGAELDLYIAGEAAEQSHTFRNTLVSMVERPNRELWPGEVALYEHNDFAGRVWILHGDVPDCRTIAGMNDRVSSIRVGPNTAATVFRHARFTGTNDVVYLDTPNLELSDVGNDAISSVSILTTQPLAAMQIGATSRLTEELSVAGGAVHGEPVLRTIVTLPPFAGAVDVWATEELSITANGKTHLVDAVRPARLKPDATGKLVILMDPDAIGGGALMLRTPTMEQRQRVFVFPDVDVHTKILAMDEDRLWQDRGRLDLGDDVTRTDAVHVGRALKALSSTVPAATRSLSHGRASDRRVMTDRMPYQRWALELGGKDNVLFRPATSAETAAAGAAAIRLDDSLGQGFFDDLGKWLSGAAEDVEEFFVETVPAAAETAAEETEEFFTETVPGAMTDAGEAIVNTMSPVLQEVGLSVTDIWDETTGWVEREAGRVVEEGEEVLDCVASSMTDAFEDLAREAGEFVTTAVDTVLRVTVKLGGKLYQFVVHTMEAIGKVVRGVLEAIGVAFQKFVDWLKDVFDFGDILNVHDFLIDRVNAGLDTAAGCVRVLQSEAEGLLSDLNDEIVAALDAAIDQAGGGALVRNPRDRHDRSEASDKLDWIMSKAVTGGGGAAGPDPLMARMNGAVPDATMTRLSQLVDSLGERMVSIAENEFGAVADAFLDALDMFRAALDQPSRAGEIILSGVLSLVKGLAVTGIAVLKGILDLLFELFLAAIDLLKIALNAALDIPFVSDLYRTLTGRELTLASLMAFIVAIPATVLGKIILGRPIFQGATRIAQSSDTDEIEQQKIKEEKQDWALLYGCCHIVLTVTDLVGDIVGGEPVWEKNRVISGTPRAKVMGVRTVFKVTSPAPESRYGQGLTYLKLVGIGTFIVAQLAANPTGHLSGLDPRSMDEGLRSRDPKTRYGHLVWAYQWTYLVIGVLDFTAGMIESYAKHKGTPVKLPDATRFVVPGLSTVAGLVHLGLMITFIVHDGDAEQRKPLDDRVSDYALGRRRFGWLMDTFPPMTKILTLKEVNQNAYYIPLLVHAGGFVLLGHLGEAITYFVRGSDDIPKGDFDL